MEQVNFKQSLKNIPAPTQQQYCELLIMSLDKTAKNFRKKAEIFLKNNTNKNTTNKETFGIKSIKNPSAVPELKNFENDLINLAQNVEFKHYNNDVQMNMKRICDDIKAEPKLIIPADKTSNFYKLSIEEHNKLRDKDVQKNFKREKKQALVKIQKEHNTIAHKLDIDDRIFKTSEQECFVKLKDHKDNFRENPQVRTLNPAKPDLGKVSKKILDDKIHVVRQKSGLNQWQNTKAAINWFRNIKNKKKCKFILFDVEQFYPSINEELLIKAINWSKDFVNFSNEEIEVILAARKSCLYLDGQAWSKKGGSIFDVGMGSFDGAEICELVGLFLLSELSGLGIDIGLYRDDGLAASSKSAREIENIKKKMSAIFKKYNLKITIEANKKRVEFLDVYFDLEKDEYGPFMKPNSVPIYVNSKSNHPPKILENIPKGINRRLSTISSSKEVFDRAAPPYQDALKKAGYNFQLKFEEPINEGEGGVEGGQQNAKKKRKRKIIWFNPPFSNTVKTKVGQQFLRLVDKHFPKGNPLHKIFNRNTVKTSYRCTPNLGRKISAHNLKILKLSKEGGNVETPCKCTKFECPVNGLCTQKEVVYNATIKRSDGVTDTYIGLTERTFKERWSIHTSNFRTRNPKSSTELSKYIWNLQDKNIEYDISWRIVSRAQGFNPLTGVCNLCNREKYFILYKPELATINKKEEIVGPCLHKHGKLLSKS